MKPPGDEGSSPCRPPPSAKPDRNFVRALISGIFLVLSALLWWLVPSRSAVPLAAQVLYRTNAPNGKPHYVLGLTNVGNVPVHVIIDGQSFFDRQWATSSVRPFKQFDGIIFRPGESWVVASERVRWRRGQLMLPYYRDNRSAKFSRLLYTLFRRDDMEPEFLFLDVTPR
jgi:hypothetical protein